MKTTGVRQVMGIMHSDVMDTVFHSVDAIGLYAIKLSAEVSADLRSELTKYCPMLYC